MDKVDVEILWTLKQTETHYLKEIDIRKNNSKLTESKELEAKLRYLEEGKFIEAVPAVFGSGHILKKSGNDLFWDNNLKKQILSFLYVDNYSLEDLMRLANSNFETVSSNIKLLQNEQLLNNDSSNENVYKITKLGEDYIKANFQKQSPINVESFSQIKIGQINIKNFQTKIDELILQVNKEPNLSKDQKTTFKEKLIDLKNSWSETEKFGQPLSAQLTMPGLKELFPKSPV
ncbi:MAG: hypothetical protein MAG458_01745 [Nitrosopumilus sp.]|nr:hypothetical protein [Nitrosopumilus sp.]